MQSGTLVNLITRYIFSDLTVGTYHFKVRSQCGTDDQSDWTPTVDFEIPADPIYAPEGLTVTQDENVPAPKDVTATWQPNDEGRAATGYIVSLQGTSESGPTAVSTTRHVFSGLAAGSYTVYVRATIGDDQSEEQAQHSFDVETPEELPDGVTGLSHSLSNDGKSVTYSWSYSSESPAISGFRATQNGGGDSVSSELGASETTWQQSNLVLNRMYTMSIYAFDSDGKQGPAESVSFTAEAKKQPPNTPTDFAHKVDTVSTAIVGPGQPVGTTISVTLSWKAATEGAPAENFTVTFTGKESQTLNGTEYRYDDVGAGEKQATVVANNDTGSSEPATLTFTIEEDCKGPSSPGDIQLNEEPATSALRGVFGRIQTAWSNLPLAAKIAIIVGVAAAGAVAGFSLLGAGVIALGGGAATLSTAAALKGISIAIKGVAIHGLTSVHVGFAGYSQLAGAGIGAFLSGLGLTASMSQRTALTLTFNQSPITTDSGAATRYSISISGESGVLHEQEFVPPEDALDKVSLSIPMTLGDWVSADTLTISAFNDCGSSTESIDINIGDEEVELSVGGEDFECQTPPAPTSGHATSGGGSPVVHLTWAPGSPTDDTPGKTIAYVIEGSGSPVDNDGTTTGTTAQFAGDEIQTESGGSWTVWAVAEGGCYSVGLGISIEATAGFYRTRTYRDVRPPPRKLLEAVSSAVIFGPQIPTP